MGFLAKNESIVMALHARQAEPTIQQVRRTNGLKKWAALRMKLKERFHEKRNKKVMSWSQIKKMVYDS